MHKGEVKASLDLLRVLNGEGSWQASPPDRREILLCFANPKFSRAPLGKALERRICCRPQSLCPNSFEASRSSLGEANAYVPIPLKFPLAAESAPLAEPLAEPSPRSPFGVRPLAEAPCVSGEWQYPNLDLSLTHPYPDTKLACPYSKPHPDLRLARTATLTQSIPKTLILSQANPRQQPATSSQQQPTANSQQAAGSNQQAAASTQQQPAAASSQQPVASSQLPNPFTNR